MIMIEKTKIKIDGLAIAILEALRALNRLEARWAMGGRKYA
jgi:hypothetical protein